MGQRVGPWPIEDFALYAFTFGGMVTLAELLFSAGAWRPRFRPSKVEGGLVLAFLGFWFIAGTAQTDPIAWLKLPSVMVPALWALWRQRDPKRASALAALSGASSPARALAVLAMPAAATLVFGLALWLQPPDAWIAAVSFWSVVGAQTAAGWLLFLAALAACIWKGAKLRRQRAEATAPVDPVPDAGR
jgi:hypothetical protein